MIRRGPREIGDGTVRLREVTPADAADLYRWRMDPEARGMFRSAAELPYETHAAFVARYFAPDNADRWFVIEAAGVPAGAIALYDLSPDGGEAEWGRFVVAPEHRRRGIGRRALVLLLELARRAGVRRLRCEVLAGNPAASLYRGLGFRQTGAFDDGGRRFLRLGADLPPDTSEI